MKKTQIEFSDERLITPSGLVFVGQILGKSNFIKNQPCSNFKRLSAETLRQRFDMIGDSLRKDIQQANVDMLREMQIEPPALDNGFVPVDIDVTPFDNSKSSKEGVSRTYKGFDGYAPIMAYIGTEGYLVNLELRIGKQHCQKETPDFLRETIELCRQLTDKPSGM